MTCEPLKRAALNRSAKCSLFFQKFFNTTSGFILFFLATFHTSCFAGDAISRLQVPHVICKIPRFFNK